MLIDPNNIFIVIHICGYGCVRVCVYDFMLMLAELDLIHNLTLKTTNNNHTHCDKVKGK